MRIYLLVAAFLVLSSPTFSQTTIHVNPGIAQNSSATGSSVDPYGSISTAVEDVFLSGGGQVLILAGTYELDSPVSITTSAGENSSVIIKPVAGEYVKFNFGIRSAFIFRESSSYITLQGIEVDGNTDETDFWSVVAENLWSNDGNPEGGGLAVILDGQHITVSNNYIHDCYQKAIEIRNGRYVVVKGNIVQSIGNTSLSGGHGIMRQQTGDEFFDDDVAGIYRWDIRENLIFNVEQRIYSWVPRKGYMKMVIDEGKSILIDDPKDTDGNQERMSARIKNNIVAFGAIDHIRLKSTPNLEVSNNTIFSERPAGEGITDKGGDTETPQFVNFICRNNAVQTIAGISAIEIDQAVLETNAAGGTPDVMNNVAMDGRVRPTDQSGITKLTNGRLFENPNGGDFRINSNLNLPGVGVEPQVISELENRASAFGSAIGWNGWITNHLKLTQTILDNIPGVNDGIAGNETVFTNAGIITSNHSHIDFEVVNGAWKTARQSMDNQSFELNPVYRSWYSSIANAYPAADGNEYERLRWGSSVVKQDQAFDPNWLTVSKVTATDNTLINGFENNFTLDGDLLVDFEGFSPSINDSWDIITAGTITSTNLGEPFDRVLFKGFTPDNYSLEIVDEGNGQVVRLTILSALPIELSVFTASALNAKAAILSWTTIRERNNDYFSVERSLDQGQWIEIGRVISDGDRDGTTAYEFIDDQPFTERNYYRLRQVDFDGNSTLSHIDSVDFTGEELQAFPNPASAWLYISGAPDGEAVRLFDVRGRDLTGDRLKANELLMRLNVQGLPAAVYYLQAGDQVRKVYVQ
jgi:hypothetical protein